MMGRESGVGGRFDFCGERSLRMKKMEKMRVSVHQTISMTETEKREMILFEFRSIH